MAPASEVDLFAPFERDVILEIRTSKMEIMPGLKIETGINKRIRTGRIPVTFGGLDADEHDLVFHGGPDKAIHGCKSERLLICSLPSHTCIYNDSNLRSRLLFPLSYMAEGVP